MESQPFRIGSKSLPISEWADFFQNIHLRTNDEVVDSTLSSPHLKLGEHPQVAPVNNRY